MKFHRARFAVADNGFDRLQQFGIAQKERYGDGPRHGWELAHGCGIGVNDNGTTIKDHARFGQRIGEIGNGRLLRLLFALPFDGAGDGDDAGGNDGDCCGRSDEADDGAAYAEISKECQSEEDAAQPGNQPRLRDYAGGQRRQAMGWLA